MGLSAWERFVARAGPRQAIVPVVEHVSSAQESRHETRWERKRIYSIDAGPPEKTEKTRDNSTGKNAMRWFRQQLAQQQEQLATMREPLSRRRSPGAGASERSSD